MVIAGNLLAIYGIFRCALYSSNSRRMDHYSNEARNDKYKVISQKLPTLFHTTETFSVAKSVRFFFFKYINHERKKLSVIIRRFVFE